MRYRQSVVVFAVSLALWVPAAAWPAEPVTGDKGGDMLVDAVVLRPLGLASTVVGGVVFVLGLPFTVPTGTVAESACQLVKRPAAYTFARPLGELEECTGASCGVCGKPVPPKRD